MAKPYSDDLRECAVAAIEAGLTREEVAELYNLALSTVGGFIKRKRETGSVSPAKFGGHKTFALAPHTDLVKNLVAEQPDSTLAELKARLAKLDFGRFRQRTREHSACGARYGSEFLYGLGVAGT